MKRTSPRILIIGAGPCGIGAAWNLHQRGYRNWTLYEQNNHAGGLSASFRDKTGFIWDLGGHVFFSRSVTFQRFLKDLPHGGLTRHQRNAWIFTHQTWIPYPLQNNIHFLPQTEYQRCLRSIRRQASLKGSPENFYDWLIDRFGRYVADRYMVPLNQKMWSYPLRRLSKDWIETRISPLSQTDRQEHHCSRIHNRHWGGNHDFFYPLHGGIGQVFRSATRSFQSHIVYDRPVRRIFSNRKTVVFQNGGRDYYDELIFTGDVRDLTAMLSPVNIKIKNAAKRLKSNSLFVLGLGFSQKRCDQRTWMYFSSKRLPFYRITNLSNYSVNNTPPKRRQGYSSLLLEIRSAPATKRQENALLGRCLKGLINCGLIKEVDQDHLISIFTRTCSNAYPLPTLSRDRILDTIHPQLQKSHIYALGRFGAFRYEAGNMDVCFMQGFRAINRILRS